jgi:hypothetical protein
MKALLQVGRFCVEAELAMIEEEVEECDVKDAVGDGSAGECGSGV